MTVVTRYAPSPTGDLHIGGARTALYCWAWARHEKGRFVLRMEDTDRARSTREAERSILEALEWLGIGWDPIPGFEGVPRQSERLERYRDRVDHLLENGHAYRCICSPDEVERMRERARAEGRTPRYDGTCRRKPVGAAPDRPFAVRVAVPEEGGLTRWNDCIAGPSGEDPSQIDDFVVARSDGSPIYHLAVVVDDHDMGVTDVIRGREHMTSTSRQLLLYQALEWEPPRFAHAPLLVGATGKKLSKREQSVSVQSYRDRGFTARAVANYIARLGWGHGDLEVFSSEQLAELFTLEGVGKSPAQVTEDKLVWLNQHYIKEMATPDLQREVAPFLEQAAGGPVEIDEGLAMLLELLRERSQTWADMAERTRFYWGAELEYEPKAARKFLTSEIVPALGGLRTALAALDTWSIETIEIAFKREVEEHGLKLGQLAQPTRVALVGGTASPGIFETLALLGAVRALARLDAALVHIARL